MPSTTQNSNFYTSNQWFQNTSKFDFYYKFSLVLRNVPVLRPLLNFRSKNFVHRRHHNQVIRQKNLMIINAISIVIYVCTYVGYLPHSIIKHVLSLRQMWRDIVQSYTYSRVICLICRNFFSFFSLFCCLFQNKILFTLFINLIHTLLGL